MVGELDMLNYRTRLIDVLMVDLALNWGLVDVHNSPGSVVCSWTDPLLQVSIGSVRLLCHHPCDADEKSCLLP